MCFEINLGEVDCNYVGCYDCEDVGFELLVLFMGNQDGVDVEKDSVQGCMIVGKIVGICVGVEFYWLGLVQKQFEQWNEYGCFYYGDYKICVLLLSFFGEQIGCYGNGDCGQNNVVVECGYEDYDFVVGWGMQVVEQVEDCEVCLDYWFVWGDFFDQFEKGGYGQEQKQCGCQYVGRVWVCGIEVCGNLLGDVVGVFGELVDQGGMGIGEKWQNDQDQLVVQ